MQSKRKTTGQSPKKTKKKPKINKTNFSDQEFDFLDLMNFKICKEKAFFKNKLGEITLHKEGDSINLFAYTFNVPNKPSSCSFANFDELEAFFVK